MPDEKKARAPTERVRLYAAETDSVFALIASQMELEKAKRVMERRLRTIPGAWRDISLLCAVLSKLIDKILETVPIDKLQQLQRNMKYMSYRVYMAKPVTIPKDEVVVSGEDMEVLTRYAHEYSCIACDKDCNKCELGKALDHTMIQSRKRNESWSWINGTEDYTDSDAMQVDFKEDSL